MADEIEFKASDEAVAGIAETMATGAKPDFTVTRARLASTWDHGMLIRWETKSAGFGELTLYRDPLDGEFGEWRWDTEGMSKQFVTEVLAVLCKNLVGKLGQ